MSEQDIRRSVETLVDARVPLWRIERMVIETTMERYGSKQVAASFLGLSLKTIYNKLQSYRAA